MTLTERARELAGIYQELDATRHNQRHTVYRLSTLGHNALTLIKGWPDEAWPNFNRSPQGPALTKQWVLDGLREGIAEAEGYRYSEHDASWMEVLRPIHGVLEIFPRLLR